MTNIKPKTCKLVRDPPLPPRGKGGWGLGALIRTANHFQNSDFPTPRGYEQAVHPPFNFFRSPEMAQGRVTRVSPVGEVLYCPRAIT